MAASLLWHSRAPPASWSPFGSPTTPNRLPWPSANGAGAGAALKIHAPATVPTAPGQRVVPTPAPPPSRRTRTTADAERTDQTWRPSRWPGVPALNSSTRRRPSHPKMLIAARWLMPHRPSLKPAVAAMIARCGRLPPLSITRAPMLANRTWARPSSARGLRQVARDLGVDPHIVQRSGQDRDSNRRRPRAVLRWPAEVASLARRHRADRQPNHDQQPDDPNAWPSTHTCVYSGFRVAASALPVAQVHGRSVLASCGATRRKVRPVGIV